MASGVLNKFVVRAKYIWQHSIEAFSDRFYLYNTRAKFFPLKQEAVCGTNEEGVVQFNLIPTKAALCEFDIVKRKLERMDNPVWEPEENCSCLICAGKTIQVVELLGAEGCVRLALSWCPACDYVQYSRRPPKEWFADWYKNSFDSPADLERNLEVRPFTWRYYKRLRPLFGERKLKVLDLGAGYGEKSMAFRRDGHQLFCIEPSQARADYLKSQGCEVVCGALGDPKVEAFMSKHGPFDVVFTYHVIEHVAGGIELFEQLASHVVEGGYFYLAIPELYKEGAMNNIFTLEHLNSFSRIAAKRFLNRIGFSVIKDGDDIFQYYTNYCQYLVGRKVSVQPVAWEVANMNPNRYPDYLRQEIHLGKLSQNGGTVRLSVFGHQALDYAYTTNDKAQAAGDSKVLIRFVHGDLPTFWAS